MTSPQDLQDRESLSALFDGELQGDAARFAYKRLARDVRWRQTCGNWQLTGDVLRGRATAPAPRGFAEGVQRELAREVREAAAVAASPAPRRRWMGGAALAASVAVAGWFVANPFDDAAPTAAPPVPAVAAAAPPSSSLPAEARPAPAAVGSTGEVAGEPPAPGDRSASPVGPRKPARTRAALASARATRAVPAPAGTPEQSVDAIDATALADPFRLPPVGAPAARPWPRAVLPGSAAGALTAGYGGAPQNADVQIGTADGLGFYPFEPRLAPKSEAASLPDAGDR